MSISMKKRGSLFLLALTVASFINIKDLHAELVYEDDLEPKVSKKQLSRLDDSSEDSEIGSQDDEEVVVVRKKRKSEDDQMTRSESLRRHRMRAELRAEDKLTEKLEELRLKDEMKRLDQVLGKEKEQAKIDDAALKVAAPAPVAAAPAITPEKPLSAIEGQSVAASDLTKIEDKDAFKMKVGITPRGGFSSMIQSNFEVNSQFTVGAGLKVDIIEHIGMEAGFSYSQYNVNAGNTYSPMYYTTYYPGYSQRSLNMNQYIIDIGPRINILKQKSRVQPFISAGFGYYRNSINLDAATKAFVSMYSPALAGDFTMSGLTGYVGGGLDFGITDTIAISGMFRYYDMLTSNQSNPISNAAFVSPNNTGAANVTTNNAANMVGYDPRYSAAQNFGKANYYTLQAGLTVSF